MGLARIYRLLEGSLVVLFTLQALRVASANALAVTQSAVTGRQADVLPIGVWGLLLVALISPLLAPRQRPALPIALSFSAAIVALARIPMSLQMPLVRLAAALVVVGAGGVYIATLLRANWRSLLTVLVAALTLDQLLRAYNTYDPSLRIWLDLPVADAVYRVPWLAFQAVLSFLLVIAIWLARRAARWEPYLPASLPLKSGLALGGFLAAEIVAFAMPNVLAHWTEVAHSMVTPWLLLATALPLLPGVRRSIGEMLTVFDERLRGSVWLLALLLLVLVGSRLAGPIAAGALIAAQFMLVLSLWWLPAPLDPQEVRAVGPSVSVGLLTLGGSISAYNLTFADDPRWLGEQGTLVILVAVGLVGLPMLFGRRESPWLARPLAPTGVAMVFVAPLAVFGLILSGWNMTPVVAPSSTLRVATYNLNGGYDAAHTFRLDLAARTIEASRADIVVLQEVDAGRPVGYGVDQAQYLARHLGMYHLFVPLDQRLYGLAILSRWPLTDGSSVLFPNAMPAGALLVRIEVAGDGRMIAVAGAQIAPGSDEERLDQLALLLGLIGDATPVALAADLGAPPQDIVYQRLIGSGFADPDELLGIEQAYTTPAVYPTARHDYVLVRGLEALDSRQVDSTASDHRLVVVEVRWPEE